MLDLLNVHGISDFLGHGFGRNHRVIVVMVLLQVLVHPFFDLSLELLLDDGLQHFLSLNAKDVFVGDQAIHYQKSLIIQDGQ